MSVRDDSEGSNGNLERDVWSVQLEPAVRALKAFRNEVAGGGPIGPQPTFENDVDELVAGDIMPGVVFIDAPPSAETLQEIKRRFNEGNEHMSNEQTVRDVMNTPVYLAVRVAALGIDPDMTVAELQRRLKIAERVLAMEPDSEFPGQTYDQTHGRWCHSSVDLLAWLTREDDQ